MGSTTNKLSSYILMEASSNRVLEGNNIDEAMLVASTAKIMTAIVCIENYDIFEYINFTSLDCNITGSKIYLEVDDSLQRIDLLYGLMLRSGNDAASALSNNDDYGFIYLMNEYAKKIGMSNSYFVNSTGLDELTYNKSSAYDMALLMIYAMKNDTFRKIASSKNYSCTSSNGKYYYFNNKHKLITSNDVLAGKTGYTLNSKRVLVSYFQRHNTEFVIVTINDSSDWKTHKDLILKTDDYNYQVICKAGLYKTNFDVDFYMFVPINIILPIKNNEKKIEVEFKVTDYNVYLYSYISDTLVSKTKILTSAIG